MDSIPLLEPDRLCACVIDLLVEETTRNQV